MFKILFDQYLATRIKLYMEHIVAHEQEKKERTYPVPRHHTHIVLKIEIVRFKPHLTTHHLVIAIHLSTLSINRNSCLD